MRTRHTTIRLDDPALVLFHDAQRVEGVDERRVARMSAEFNERALGSVTYSLRANGKKFVLDGRHRITAGRMAGYAKAVPAIEHYDLTPAQEAELFVLLNTFKQPSAVSRFLARAIAGEEAAVLIRQAVKSHGWRIGQSSSDGYISAVEALDRIYRDCAGTVPAGDHPEAVDWVLEILTSAWERDRESANAAHLLGVAQIIGRFGTSVDTERLVKKMRQTRPDNVLGKAKNLRDVQGGTVPAAVAKVLIGLYNNGLRTNLLPEWVWVR